MVVIRKTYGQYLGYIIAANDSNMNNYIKDVLPLAENNYWSLMGMITSLLDTNQYIHIAEKYLEKAKHLSNNQLLKTDNTRILYLEEVIAKKKLTPISN